MEALKNFGAGYRTYLAAALAAFVAFNAVCPVVSPEVQNAILAAAAALGLYGLRSAISRQDEPAEPRSGRPRDILPYKPTIERLPDRPAMILLVLGLAIAAASPVHGQPMRPMPY